MQSQKQGRKFWVKVIVVGLLAGLIGGGAAVGINQTIANWQSGISSPRSSNKAGGTSVNKNKASQNNESTAAYKKVNDSVVSVIKNPKAQ